MPCALGVRAEAVFLSPWLLHELHAHAHAHGLGLSSVPAERAIK